MRWGKRKMGVIVCRYRGESKWMRGRNSGGVEERGGGEKKWEKCRRTRGGGEAVMRQIEKKNKQMRLGIELGAQPRAVWQCVERTLFLCAGNKEDWWGINSSYTVSFFSPFLAKCRLAWSVGIKMRHKDPMYSGHSNATIPNNNADSPRSKVSKETSKCHNPFYGDNRPVGKCQQGLIVMPWNQ